METDRKETQAASDAAMMSRIADGDAQAARALVNRFLPQITSYAARLLSDAAEAEDVAQEVFMKAWTKGARFDAGRASLSAWLYAIARNLCLDRLRKRQVRGGDVYAADESIIADPAPDPLAQTLAREHAGAMARALSELPERQKSALLLSVLDGLAHAEIAQVLETSTDAVESLVARARKRLRTILEAPDTHTQDTSTHHATACA